MKTNLVLSGAVLSALFLAAACASTEKASDGDTLDNSTTSEMGECHGINACKGKGECGGKGHSCAGKNKCKGKGWVRTSKEDCEAKKGKFKS